MQYSIPIDVLTSHTKDNPARVRAHFGAGVLRKVDIIFPPGSAGLVHISIFHENKQILPTNPEQTYRGDGVHITTQCHVNLTKKDNVLTVVGYGDGCTYSHTVYILFEVRDPDEPDIVDVLQRQISLLDSLVSIYKSAFW